MGVRPPMGVGEVHLVEPNRTYGLDPGLLRQALLLGLVFSCAKLLVQVAATWWSAYIGYGYFRDEMYYIICGRHLAWGYVDHGPLVALQARLAILLFGKSLVGVRMLSALAGAVTVGFTGILTWSLGGRRPAQALAMLGVIVSPQFLGTDGFLSMNSFEPVFWTISVLSLVLLVRGESKGWWLVFGASGGVGLLNKPSMLFFLAALLAGILLTPQRRLLRSGWAVASIGLILLIVAPYAMWQLQNHWPTWEFLHNGAVRHKNVNLPPIKFVLVQVLNMFPVNLLIWGFGLIWLLGARIARPYRWMAFCYLIFLALMMAAHAKDYYLAPIYPALFAAGGVAWEGRFSRKSGVAANRAWAFPVMQTVMVLGGILVLPLTVPILRPLAFVRYSKALHVQSNNTENQQTSELPQFFADRFGWQEYVNQVSEIYQSLSPEEQKDVGIGTDNYGEASAINFLGRALPIAISTHNNYWIWGPHGYSGQVMILITARSPAELKERYASVEVVGHMDNPWAMPYERKNIYLVRGLKGSYEQYWLTHKDFI